jgi:8-oxo-dGTP pyrophosphatase MutT (NUDIX family)
MAAPRKRKPGPPKGDAQFAALPWRRRADGGVEVLVITSRETRRWVLPKGWPMKAMTPAEAAAREAYEEAGVIGQTEAEPIGAYPYAKRLRGGALQTVQVQVFAMEVTAEQRAWPEKDQRDKLWTTRETAADLVEEPELKALIRGFAPG